MVRPTAAGRRAQALGQALFEVIETRWRERFGDERVGELRQSLEVVVDQLDGELPHYPPVGGLAAIHDLQRRAPARRERLDLPALLSQALLTFAIDYERESKIPLSISANTLRVLDETGVLIGDLPRRTGIAKESIGMSLTFLQRHGCAVVEAHPSAGPRRRARLTPKGRRAQDNYRRGLSGIETRWGGRFGEENVRRLRSSLEAPIGEPTGGRSPLYDGLEPYPDGWRASVRRPDTLPHYPIVSHRGGYPDGS